ncbi:MAG: hypothetical protein EBQ88_03750 [Betaproteobacteria bacterium]|nr:hypothetical protein [Betaproteobacteria bacterium]
MALRAAREFFHMKVAELYGCEIPQKADREPLFSELVAPTLSIERARAARGELSHSGLRILQNRLQRKVIPFFGEMSISAVGLLAPTEI